MTDTRPTVKILIVVDGIFGLGDQSTDDSVFTLSHLQKVLRLGRYGPNGTKVTIDTAHREGETPADPTDTVDPNAKPSHATINGKFRFVAPVPPRFFLNGEVTVELSAYDQIWLFGYDGVNGGGSDASWWTYLGDDEIAAITGYMNRGGGVFAAGDHSSLGAVLCGAIPRVRTMRKWFDHYDPDTKKTAPALDNSPGATNPLRNWPDSGPDRADTLMPSTTNGTDFFIENQSDAIPQLLTMPGGVVHPLLQTSIGPLTGFPDHGHEGEVLGYGGKDNISIPYVIKNGELVYTGQDFGAEYPTIFIDSERPFYKEKPKIIAMGAIQPHHDTKVDDAEKPQRCKSGFVGDPDPTPNSEHPILLNTLSVYDGHNVGVGRVVTDSSFHHYLDLNLIGDLCALHQSQLTGFLGTPFLAQMEDYYFNLIRYLSGPSLFPIVCLGDDNYSRKAYFLRGNNSINEASWTDRWYGDTAPNSVANQSSALTCWASSASTQHIYFFDRANRVTGADHTLPPGPNQTPVWTTTQLSLIRAAPGSGITCTGPDNGNPPSVYYIDRTNKLNQLSPSPTTGAAPWTNTVLPSHNVAVGSSLTSVYSVLDGPAIYYIDSANTVNECSYDVTDGTWSNIAISPADAIPLSGNLASFLPSQNAAPAAGWTHVYYVDNITYQVSELRLGGGHWSKTVLPGFARQEGSSIACYGFNGIDPRVYYVAKDGTINELSKTGSGPWTNLATGSKEVRRRSQIAVINWGTHGQLYYMDVNGGMNVMEWNGLKWVGSSFLQRSGLPFPHFPPLGN